MIKILLRRQNRGEFMTLDEAIAHAREKAKEKRKEMQCKTCKLFVRSDLHPLQGYCRKNEFHSIEIDSWSKVCSEYVPKEMCKCAEEHEQLAEWLEELKFLKQWKSDIMEEFCKYDVSSFEELVTNARNKAIDDFANGISEYLGVENATKYGNKNVEQQRISYDTLMKYEIADAIEDVAEELKAGVTNA